MLRRGGKAQRQEPVNKFVEVSEINFAFHDAHKMEKD